jgi:hypothetical protein
MNYDKVLPKPYRLVTPGNGQSVHLRVDSFELGLLRTDETPEQPSRDFEMVRLHGQRIDREVPWFYFDVTSKLLRASLVPYLETLPRLGREIKFTAYGVFQRKRYVWEAR